MTTDAAIGRLGFRRWYERQLYEGFAWMITGLFSLIMMATALEVIEFRNSQSGLLVLILVALAGCALCVVAWGRFNRLLARAEYLAEQATCAECRAYARFAVVRSRAVPGTVTGCSMTVRCRTCGNEWSIA